MLYVLNFDCLCVIIACLVKEPIPKEEPIVPNNPTPDGEHLSEDEDKSHWTFLIILLLYVWLSLVEPD
jgi:hypothetical protein